MDRNELRAALLKTRVPDTKRLIFFGQEIEIRQPKLKDILAARQKEDQTEAMIDMILTYVVVPGTEDRLFEEGDRAQLLELPFGPDMSALSTAISELTGLRLDVEGAAKNSNTPTSNGQSSS